MSPDVLRLGVVCDLLEEGWHSMDLIADMLLERLPEVARGQIAATRLCPPMTRRWTTLPWVGSTARAHLGDRLTGRLWDYPRWLAPRAADFDLFHVVDHSYAHLVRALLPRPTVVTCNDVDAIEAALPGRSSRLAPARLLASSVLDGLAHAAHVACISEATRTQLLATGCLEPGRVSVVYLGVHPSCTPEPDPRRDCEIDERVGAGRLALLHVGSTIPRKRIDTLLEVLRGVREEMGDVVLLRAGGPLASAQRDLARKLGVAGAIVEFPFVERPVLAALYRRAALLLLPSDREGFGLPLVESMACGTPVVASAIPALREIGGDAVSFCTPGAISEWVLAVGALLRQRRLDHAGWGARQRRCVAAAARFNWTSYASEMAARYAQTLAMAPAAVRQRSRVS
ncbi:MAG TPA: glycosyltransferase [Vicinamibacterales bacterium]|nr:glycosyltransferase [Vicinamibacterales bacterium]